MNDDAVVVKKPRPKWTPKLQRMILTALSHGITLRKACKKMGISPKMVATCLVKSPEFREQYARARDACMDSWADEIVDCARAAVNSETAQAMRVRMDGLKWTLSKLKPDKYGDRLDLHQTGKVEHVHTSADQRTELISIMEKYGLTSMIPPAWRTVGTTLAHALPALPLGDDGGGGGPET